MKLVKCKSGHMYNEQAHNECPYCNTSKILSTVMEKSPVILKSESKTISYWIKEIIKLKYPLNIMVQAFYF